MRKVLSQFISKLRRNIRGNVLVVTAIGAASTVGAAGLGVDTVQWFLAKRQLQQAADSGALSGAMSLYRGNSITIPVEEAVDLNFPDAVTSERIVSPPAVGAYAGDTGAVEVVVTVDRPLPFSGIFIDSTPVIRSRAVATAVATGEPCVIATATSGIGIKVFGTADVDLDCPIASNSPDGISVDLVGSSFLDTNMIMSVGGVSYSSTNIPSDAAVVSYGLPVEDPLASKGLTPPTNPTGCTYNNERVQPGQTALLLPGRYCNGLRIQGTARLSGGVYIIDGGTLAITASAIVELAGTGGVTFVLTGNTSSTVADVNINGGATVDLQAPTAAEATVYGDANWAGILFFQDPLGDGTQHTFNGGADINLNGIIYMPTGELLYNGNASQAAQCLLLIGQVVEFGGTNSIANNCNDDIDDNLATAWVIRVVE